LGSVPVGRLGLSLGALPTVLPVNFCLCDDQIVVRTTAGSKLDAALHHAVVAFEADQLESIGHTGWSVLVRGSSRVLVRPSEVAQAAALRLRPWGTSGTDADRFIAISTDLVSGRRIRSWYRPRAEGEPYVDGFEPTPARASHPLPR
jgi:nitroimidazol reductase NimA-like FMN-containing flavoprotein (pyridoxamine 5'-phosphate oxidase superfamily)